MIIELLLEELGANPIFAKLMISFNLKENVRLLYLFILHQKSNLQEWSMTLFTFYFLHFIGTYIIIYV